jgi:hypothetical protein
MSRTVVSIGLLGGFLVSFVVLAGVNGRAAPDKKDDDRRIEEGLRLVAPLNLNLKGRKRDQVGLGSYLVNAVGGCNDCHTCPSYKPGHNPYGPPFGPPNGGDGATDFDHYLAGGVLFDPPGVVSKNLTPNPGNGLPEEEGHTFAQFKSLLRTGRDPDDPTHILQVMPWPVYRNMTDDDLRAIYEFLKSIPHAEPGICVAPGQ